MNDITSILQDYTRYYNTIRKVGHTSLAVAGLENCENGIFICSNHVDAEQFAKHLSLNTMTFADTEKLRGMNRPLAWDNEALRQIFGLSLQKIFELETRIAKLTQ